MAVKYVPSGYGQFVQDLAAKAGAAQAATKTAEMAFQMAEADKGRQFQAQMQNLLYEVQLESARRSAMWDIEKMETRSRLDFEKEEQNRVQRKQQLDLDIQSLDKAAKEYLINPKELPKMKEATYLKYLDLPEAAQELFRTPRTMEELNVKGMMDKSSGPAAVQNPSTPSSTGQVPTAKPASSSIQPPDRFIGLVSTPDGKGIIARKESGAELKIEASKKYRVVESDGVTIHLISGDTLPEVLNNNPDWDLQSEAGSPVQLDVRKQTPDIGISKEDRELSGAFIPTGHKELTQQLHTKQIDPKEVAKVTFSLKTAEQIILSKKTNMTMADIRGWIKYLKKQTALNPEQQDKKDELLEILDQKMEHLGIGFKREKKEAESLLAPELSLKRTMSLPTNKIRG